MDTYLTHLVKCSMFEVDIKEITEELSAFNTKRRLLSKQSDQVEFKSPKFTSWTNANGIFSCHFFPVFHFLPPFGYRFLFFRPAEIYQDFSACFPRIGIRRNSIRSEIRPRGKVDTVDIPFFRKR